MSRSRRTLLSVLVFLSFNNNPVMTQTSTGKLPTSTENCQNFKSLTPQPANLRPNLLSAAQRLLAGTKRPTLNDFSTQPFIAKPPVVTIEPSYQQVPINVNPAPNLPVRFTQTTCNTAFPVSSSPETLPVEAVETTSSITELSIAPLILEYTNAVDQNYVPLSPMLFGQISQTLSLPEALYVDNFVHQPELPQFCQSPVTQFSSFANPVSSTFSQNLFERTRELVPVLYPETINSQQTPVFLQTETVPVGFGSNIVDSGSGYLSSLEAFYVDNFVHQPDLLQFYQSPVTVQATPNPVVSPFTSLANPVSSTFSQNLFEEARELVPALYPETINSQQTPVFSQTETVSVGFGSNIVDSGSGYTMPLSLQINLPSPTSEQPIILLSPPPPAPGHQDTSYMTPLPPMVPPLIVMERSRSRWRNILPILLIALCDGGCCQNSGSSGCSGNCNIPIPYPIPIPTNNPIILGQGNKKEKR